MCFVKTIALLVLLLLGCPAKKLDHSDCYTTKIRTEILSNNNSFEIFHLPKINIGKLKFDSVFKNCNDLTIVLACNPYNFSNLGFMPLNKAVNYLSLDSEYSEYMVITNIYTNNQTISFVPQH